MGEQEIISFGKKIKVKIIKVSDEPITRIKKKKVQEKRKILKFSMPKLNENIIDNLKK